MLERRPPYCKRRLQFERLEPRLVLSGAAPDVFWPLVDPPSVDKGELAEAEHAVERLIVNQQVTDDPSVQQHPRLAVNPQDSDHIVIAYNDEDLVSGRGRFGVGVSTSRDGGATWQRSAIKLPEGFDEIAGLADVAFDQSGRVFVYLQAGAGLGEEFSAVNVFQVDVGVFLVRSDDGGLTWTEPVAIEAFRSEGADHPFTIGQDLAVDNFATLPDGSPNPNFGNLYATWTQVYPGGQAPGRPQFGPGFTELMIAVSRDGGATWETQLQPREFWNDENGDGAQQASEVVAASVTVLSDPVFENIDGSFLGTPIITIGPEGDVYVAAWLAAEFGVFRSTDGGANFTAPDRDAELGLPFGPGSVSPDKGGWPDSRFTAHRSRSLVADPTRPGHLYAAEAITVFDQDGPVDFADIFFARSTDNGSTWESTTGGGPVTPVDGGPDDIPLNDDNGGQSALRDAEDQVVAAQGSPWTAIDERGKLTVIWYDTRRDPKNLHIDIFGAASTDGGRTFTANFRVTDQSIDLEAGKYLNLFGREDVNFGDTFSARPEPVLADGDAYAAWTDTRAGNQDIFFARFSVDPAPLALNDRYEPNDTASAATDLGGVVQMEVPKLGVAGDDEDWFRARARTTGRFSAGAFFSNDSAAMNRAVEVEIWDSTGQLLLGRSTELTDQKGNAIAAVADTEASAAEEFLIRVRNADVERGRRAAYKLFLQSLTADLGGRAFTSVSGSLTTQGAALYKYTAVAAGAIDVELVPGENSVGRFNLQILDPESFGVLAKGVEESVKRPENLVQSVEPNDTIFEPQALLLDSRNQVAVEGFIGDGDFAELGDVDFYSVELTAGQRLVIDVDAEVLGSGINAVVELFGFNSGKSFGGFLDDGQTNDPLVDFLAPAADTYVFVIGDFDAGPANIVEPGTLAGPGATGSYQFTIAVTQPGSPLKASVDIQQGETVLIQITSNETSSGDFTLAVANLDQFAAPDPRTLLFAGAESVGSVEAADLNGDGHVDVVRTGRFLSTVEIMLGNGDGTFQAPREFRVGPVGGKSLRLADVSSDGILDVIVGNSSSADVSILLGRGDGTFESPRRFDATAAPFGLVIDDFDGDGDLDLVVGEDGNTSGASFALLKGRGDGTFAPPKATPLQPRDAAPRAADFNGDGLQDLALFTDIPGTVEIHLATGDGAFAEEPVIVPFPPFKGATAVADLDGDGNLDLLATDLNTGEVIVRLGAGDLTFQPTQRFLAGAWPGSITVADFGSRQILPDGGIVLGPPDGRLDLVVTNAGVQFSLTAPDTDPEVVLLPGVFDFDEDSNFILLGEPIRLAKAAAPFDSAAVDVNCDGALDLLVAELGGVLVIYGATPDIAPNNSQQTARELGPIVHLVERTRTIVPGREEAWFRMTVPIERAADRDQVLDFSALFEGADALGLQMEVRDAAGNVLGADDRLRISAAQGAELFVRIFGVAGPEGARGSGAYTLAVNVLPQVVGVEVDSIIPGADGRSGGPVNSITLVLQGDRLDPTTAENPENYTVRFLGADGLSGTADDRILAIGGDNVEQPIVYNPGANVEVSSGQTFPTAVRQTVTLIFAAPLPAGSYAIDISADLQTRPFSEAELTRLARAEAFAGHPVVAVIDGEVLEGARVDAQDLVASPSLTGDFASFTTGTRFLTQLQNDLQVSLDNLLGENGDDPGVTPSILQQIITRTLPSLGEVGGRLTSLLILFFDPVSFSVVDRDNQRIVYNLQENSLRRGFRQAFVEVGGNVEFVVIPRAAGSYEVNIGDVPRLARGGAILLSNAQTDVFNLTPDIRQGVTNFRFTVLTAIPTFENPSLVTRGNTATPSGLAATASSFLLQTLVAESSLEALARGGTEAGSEGQSFSSNDSGSSGGETEENDDDQTEDEDDLQEDKQPAEDGESQQQSSGDERNDNDRDGDSNLESDQPSRQNSAVDALGQGSSLNETGAPNQEHNNSDDSNTIKTDEHEDESEAAGAGDGAAGRLGGGVIQESRLLRVIANALRMLLEIWS